MNKYHQLLLQELKSYSDLPDKLPDGYSGSHRSSYPINTSHLKEVVKKFVHNYHDLSSTEFVELLNSLYLGESSTEKRLGGYLLKALPQLQECISPDRIQNYLSELSGWSEVDSLCQNVFQYTQILNNWPQWSKFLTQWSKSPDLSLQRASLVLLTGPVAHSEDRRLSDLAFDNINRLQSSKDILITKAISWLLRALTVKHSADVEQYLAHNLQTLPKIALRETSRKLATGKK